MKWAEQKGPQKWQKDPALTGGAEAGEGRFVPAKMAHVPTAARPTDLTKFDLDAVSKGTGIRDISPLISPRIGVWPGDVPFKRKKSATIAKGSNVDLGSFSATYHLGAHADSPQHFLAEGDDAATVDLRPYIGPCQVVHVEVARGERIRPRDIKETVSAPRVLIRTGTFPDPENWNNDFAALSEELVDWLGALQVMLVGIDTPSIDLFDDKHLESHHALHRHGMANLEGLVLDGVPPGRYFLSALPLRIEGADASPVRAVLIG